jgi:hypothetical protein
MTINSIKKHSLQDLHGYQLNSTQFLRIEKILDIVRTEMKNKSVVLAKSTYLEKKNSNTLTMDLFYNNAKLALYEKNIKYFS